MTPRRNIQRGRSGRPREMLAAVVASFAPAAGLSPAAGRGRDDVSAIEQEERVG